MCSFPEELRGRVDKAAATWRPSQAIGRFHVVLYRARGQAGPTPRLCFCAGVAQPATATCGTPSWAACAQRVMSPSCRERTRARPHSSHLPCSWAQLRQSTHPGTTCPQHRPTCPQECAGRRADVLVCLSISLSLHGPISLSFLLSLPPRLFR